MSPVVPKTFGVSAQDRDYYICNLQGSGPLSRAGLKSEIDQFIRNRHGVGRVYDLPGAKIASVCAACAPARTVFVVPGGYTPAMVRDLTQASAAELLSATVRSGAGYLGVCAGANIAVAQYEAVMPGLGLLTGLQTMMAPMGWCEPAHFDHAIPVAVSCTKASSLRRLFGGEKGITQATLKWVNGPAIYPLVGASLTADVTELAHYAEGPAQGQVVALASRSGLGQVVVSGVHPEIAVAADETPRAKQTRQRYIAMMLESLSNK